MNLLVGIQIHVRQGQVLQRRQRYQQCHREPKGRLQSDFFHTLHFKSTTKGRPRFIWHTVPIFSVIIEAQPKGTEIREEPQRPQIREPRDSIGKTVLSVNEESEVPDMGPKIRVR
jgi:hypothetical protein